MSMRTVYELHDQNNGMFNCGSDYYEPKFKLDHTGKDLLIVPCPSGTLRRADGYTEDGKAMIPVCRLGSALKVEIPDGLIVISDKEVG